MKISNVVLALFIAAVFMLFGFISAIVGQKEIGGLFAVIGGIFIVCSGIAYMDNQEANLVKNRPYY